LAGRPALNADGNARPGYIFDNAATEASGRFGALEELFDANSIRHLEPLVVPGARCLEVGGGSGSLALWMSQRAGEGGRVLVTDLNTRFLEHIDAPNVEVRQHDIVTDPLEEGAFDVAHTRLVLVHIPERKRVIERVITALKPGGWLVLEEFDSLSMPPDPAIAPSEHLLKTLRALWAQMLERGANPGIGRQLFPWMREMGLKEVTAEGRTLMFQGGSAGGRLFKANFEQVHDALVASGRLTEEEFAADIARLDDPDITWPSSVMWTARGRKP
jgi:SAM-dependent methyltransferase